MERRTRKMEIKKANMGSRKKLERKVPFNWVSGYNEKNRNNYWKQKKSILYYDKVMDRYPESLVHGYRIIFVPWEYQKKSSSISKNLFYRYRPVVLSSGIDNSAQLNRDPLRGNIYENLVIMEVLKTRLNTGQRPDLYFYRDSNGKEVDLLILDGRSIQPIEIKS